jgi:hypothetical protein
MSARSARYPTPTGTAAACTVLLALSGGLAVAVTGPFWLVPLLAAVGTAVASAALGRGTSSPDTVFRRALAAALLLAAAAAVLWWASSAVGFRDCFHHGFGLVPEGGSIGVSESGQCVLTISTTTMGVVSAPVPSRSEGLATAALVVAFSSAVPPLLAAWRLAARNRPSRGAARG